MILPNKCVINLLCFFAVFAAITDNYCMAQAAYPDIPSNRYLLLATEQIQQEHYAMAAQSARQFLSQQSPLINQNDVAGIETARYYITLAGLKTYGVKCADSALLFLAETSSKTYKQRINFALAQYYFQQNEWSQAIPYYEATGIDNLSNAEIGDLKFEIAYCYFNNKQFDKSKPLFSAIIAIKDGKYYKPGNYYYGLLAYNENKYTEALESFDKIKDDKEYKLVVPYYMAEIYYFKGQKEKALQTAEYFINNNKKSLYDNDLHLLAAQCLFEDEHYAEAAPYFEYYYEHSDKIKKEDLYKMAYCNYRLADWTHAIEKFKILNNAKDSLGQTSMYLLGDCYLKTNDKTGARSAFGFCSAMNFNKAQQEASKMLYAKISYELGYDDEAMQELKDLLDIFPGTKYKDEANTLLSDLLLKTNHYEDALNKLNAVTSRSSGYWLTYQKANFAFAVQLFRKENTEGAYNHFLLSVKHPVDNVYETVAYFWLGELCFRLMQYPDVITYSQKFISRKENVEALSKLSPQATVQHAYLNMGYAAMESKNFSAAQGYFNHAQQAAGKDEYTARVAMLHEADALFMQKSFQKAIALYDKVAATDSANSDYAHYQKAIIYGLQGKTTEKIALLQAIASELPPSPYADEARYEIALTYIESDKYKQALNFLRLITGNGSNQGLIPGALMKEGFIYQQLNNTDSAIYAYKSIVINYPSSDERPAAMDALRSLYIQNNMPEAYAKMLRDNNLPEEAEGGSDSTYYAAAESRYATGNWQETLKSLDTYLHQFPNGIFSLKAHYYRGDCETHLQDSLAALTDFILVLKSPWNDFSENSARQVATIYMGMKNYDSALYFFKTLRLNAADQPMVIFSYSGMMKCNYYLGNYKEAVDNAGFLTGLPGLSADNMNEGLMIKAKSFQQLKNTDSAIAIYQQLSNNKNGEIAAESRYRIAETLLNLDSLKSAEDAANKAIKQSAGFDYWIVKSYILLADVLYKENDVFNAKATLESIISHTKIPELKEEANQKLDEVKKSEKKHSKLSDE